MRLRPLRRRSVAVKRPHHGSGGGGCQRTADQIGRRRAVLVAEPDADRPLRGERDTPRIAVAVGSAGFPRDRQAACPRQRPAAQHRREHFAAPGAPHRGSGGSGGILQQQKRAMDTAGGDRAIGVGEVEQRHIEAAERQRKTELGPARERRDATARTGKASVSPAPCRAIAAAGPPGCSMTPPAPSPPKPRAAGTCRRSFRGGSRRKSSGESSSTVSPASIPPSTASPNRNGFSAEPGERYATAAFTCRREAPEVQGTDQRPHLAGAVLQHGQRPVMNRGMKRNAPLQQCQRGVLKFRVESDRHPFRQRGFRAPLGQLEKLRIGRRAATAAAKSPGNAAVLRHKSVRPPRRSAAWRRTSISRTVFCRRRAASGCRSGTEAVGALRDSGEQRAFGEVQLRRGPARSSSAPPLRRRRACRRRGR